MSKARTQNRPFLLGLTGSIGMGKSTVAEMFRARGVPVFDADAEVRQMQAKGSPVLEEIEAAFPGVTSEDGLDRAALGERVFGDEAALARLEALIHPKVAGAREAFLSRHRDADLVVMDIPLLYENGGFEALDAVAVVSAPADIQRERVLARPGMSAEKFADILARQMPDREKRERADYVIDTSCSLAETEAAVAALIERIKSAK